MGFNIDARQSADYLQDIKGILHQAKDNAYSAVNSAMVQAYWLIGRRIVIEELGGKARADYGKQLIKQISKNLSEEFKTEVSERRLREYRQFYQTYSISEKWHSLNAISENITKSETLMAVFTRLSWTHIRHLLRVSNQKARAFYAVEAVANNWSTRTLDRNISTQYYERLLASQVKAPVKEEMEKLSSDLQDNKLNFIKNPMVLEFLNLPTQLSYTEQALEKALIDDIQKFMLELGKGYAFVERQQLVRTESSDFYIDLVFYNYILKCFVIIEIKTEKISHQDIGQLDMYVRMYDDLKRNEGDNPTIGILLCADTDKAVAKYSVLKDSQQLFASKYLSYLPSEAELKAEIERQREVFETQQNMEGLGYGE